jgi:hypothetical protein
MLTTTQSQTKLAVASSAVGVCVRVGADALASRWHALRHSAASDLFVSYSLCWVHSAAAVVYVLHLLVQAYRVFACQQLLKSSRTHRTASCVGGCVCFKRLLVDALHDGV